MNWSSGNEERVWHCNEAKGCKAILVTEVNELYEIIAGQSSQLELHAQHHSIPTAEDMLRKKFLDNVKVKLVDLQIICNNFVSRFGQQSQQNQQDQSFKWKL